MKGSDSKLSFSISVFVLILVVLICSSCSFMFDDSETLSELIYLDSIVGTWVGSIESYSGDSFNNGNPEMTKMEYKCTLILNEDGTGIIQKPFEKQLDINWQIKGEIFVLKYWGNTYECSYSIDEFSLVFKQLYYSSNGFYLYRFEKETLPNPIDNDSSTKKLESIRVVHRPDRMIYMFDEEFDRKGMVVYAMYSDGSRIDISDRITMSSFDSSGVVPHGTSITISYHENGITKTDTIYTYVGASYIQSHQTGVKASRIEALTPRTVKVSFQYYHRNNTTENYMPYSYSDNPYDDINGTMIYKITEKGMACYAENLDYELFYYLPTNSTEIITSSEYDDLKVKPPKYIYIGENIISEVSSVGHSNQYAESYRFSTAGETLFPFERANYSNLKYYYETSEDSLYSLYDSDYSGKVEHIVFDGVDYPFFEINESNQLVKGTTLSVIDYYWLMIMTVEIIPGDPAIEWPDYLWGIDHFN